MDASSRHANWRVSTAPTRDEPTRKNTSDACIPTGRRRIIRGIPGGWFEWWPSMFAGTVAAGSSDPPGVPLFCIAWGHRVSQTATRSDKRGPAPGNGQGSRLISRSRSLAAYHVRAGYGPVDYLHDLHPWLGPPRTRERAARGPVFARLGGRRIRGLGHGRLLPTGTLPDVLGQGRGVPAGSRR